MTSIKSTAFLALVATASAFSETSQDWSNGTDSQHSYHCKGPALPLGSGPVPTPDTAEAFHAYDEFSKTALAAPAPAGYDAKFADSKSSIQGPDYYLGYHELKEYSPSACADICDDTKSCAAFNVFYERSPKVDPSPKCKNPPSTTQIKCSLWSSETAPANATNNGQWREAFHVVIAGSNSYARQPEAACPGYKTEHLGRAAITAPLDCAGAYTYMGYKVHDVASYSLARCADDCNAQNAYNLAHAPANGSEPLLCHFVNSYIERVNGVPQGHYCAMYSKAWHWEQATNKGQYRLADHVTISRSVGIANATGEHDGCAA